MGEAGICGHRDIRYRIALAFSIGTFELPILLSTVIPT
ncbi:hypothetical protein DFR24_0576 [Panacagrimonas perspica]|uniref:Uncharacterized protein n=1 Tax=Panacagrimonas perspica TaxID=381431 RepID=A0A4R7PAW7_9GAMM|nr:hypothetical protein DFR24_0576 [Panacagrimonas perspica]